MQMREIITTVAQANGWTVSVGHVNDYMTTQGWDPPGDALIESQIEAAGFRPAHPDSAVWVPVSPDEEDAEGGSLIAELAAQNRRLLHENEAMRQVLHAAVLLSDMAAEVLEGTKDEAPIVAGLRAIAASAAAFGGPR